MYSTTTTAIDFIERQTNNNTPFFLQISHYAVHSDIMMREVTLDKYQELPKGKYQNHAGFAAMTEDLDTSVGLLLDKVKALGLENDTYIIYTSDNGAVPMMPPKKKYINGSNTPLSRGKWDAMEGGIRVPFIIAGPKIRAGIESRVPISFSDLLPSIIDIAGSKLPLHDHLDGGSFKKVAFKSGKGEVKRNNDAIVFHVPYENGIALKRAHSAIIVDNFKLIKFYDNNELMLFELNSDYEEKYNLAKVLIEKTKTLESTLDAYLIKVKAPKWQPGISWKNKQISEINSFH
jgi:arylsulfatase A-like enzyme